MIWYDMMLIPYYTKRYVHREKLALVGILAHTQTTPCNIWYNIRNLTTRRSLLRSVGMLWKAKLSVISYVYGSDDGCPFRESQNQTPPGDLTSTSDRGRCPCIYHYCQLGLFSFLLLLLPEQSSQKKTLPFQIMRLSSVSSALPMANTGSARMEGQQ
jgi:hypothetical protein